MSKGAGSPDSAASAVARGVELMDRGAFEEALAQFEAASDLDMNHLEAYGWMASALSKLGRYDEAQRNADHALWLDQFSAWAWNRKGSVFFDMGDFKMALQCFRRALDLEPGFGAAAENIRRTEGLAGVNAALVDGGEEGP